ncbi:unnamed protein product, partial [Closterium sp. NIES-53]
PASSAGKVWPQPRFPAEELKGTAPCLGGKGILLLMGTPWLNHDVPTIACNSDWAAVM